MFTVIFSVPYSRKEGAHGASETRCLQGLLLEGAGYPAHFAWSNHWRRSPAFGFLAPAAARLSLFKLTEKNMLPYWDTSNNIIRWWVALWAAGCQFTVLPQIWRIWRGSALSPLFHSDLCFLLQGSWSKAKESFLSNSEHIIDFVLSVLRHPLFIF